MYIIQSNINKEDFQSIMYKVTDLTWEEFKEYILNNDDSTKREFIGTMEGIHKPKNCKIKVADINDEHHLRVSITRGSGIIYTSEYYLVTDENFQNLIR